MDGRRPAQAGAQNPAYRPTHPPYGDADPQYINAHTLSEGTFGHTRPSSPERLVERIPAAQPRRAEISGSIRVILNRPSGW